MNPYPVSIFAWYGYNEPLRHRLRHIQDAGFDSIMLWWGESLAFYEYDKDSLIRLLAAHDLAIENIHAPYLDASRIWSPDAAERQRTVAAYLEWLDDCARYGIPTLVMHICDRFDDIPSGALGYGLGCLETLVRAAERLGVRIAVENTSHLHLLQYLLDRIDSAALGLCYDSSHGRLYEETPFALLRQYPTRLYALHLSDNDGVEDRHWEIGKGLIDWDGFAAAFPAGLYRGRLSLEIIQDDAGEDEAHFLRRARQCIDALGAQLPAPPAADLDAR